MVRPVQIPVTDSSAGRASALLEIQGAWFQNPSLVRHYFCHLVTFGAVPTPGTGSLTPARRGG